MKLLALDTSTLTASVAVLDGDRVVQLESRADPHASAKSGGRTSEVLVAIDDACRQAGIAPGELQAVAVGAGPGSFTGLRIGMATAKGIAFAAGVPLWAVSSLAALAYGHAGLVGAVLDARRGEIFAGVYQDGILVGEERVLAPADLPKADRYVGDARSIFPDLSWTDATPSALSVARLALAGARVDVLVGGAPTYIRPSEAEVKYPNGVPGALKQR